MDVVVAVMADPDPVHHLMLTTLRPNLPMMAPMLSNTTTHAPNQRLARGPLRHVLRTLHHRPIHALLHPFTRQANHPAVPRTCRQPLPPTSGPTWTSGSRFFHVFRDLFHHVAGPIRVLQQCADGELAACATVRLMRSSPVRGRRPPPVPTSCILPRLCACSRSSGRFADRTIHRYVFVQQDIVRPITLRALFDRRPPSGIACCLRPLLRLPSPHVRNACQQPARRASP